MSTSWCRLNLGKNFNKSLSPKDIRTPMSSVWKPTQRVETGSKTSCATRKRGINLRIKMESWTPVIGRPLGGVTLGPPKCHFWPKWWFWVLRGVDPPGGSKMTPLRATIVPPFSRSRRKSFQRGFQVKSHILPNQGQNRHLKARIRPKMAKNVTHATFCVFWKMAKSWFLVKNGDFCTFWCKKWL